MLGTSYVSMTRAEIEELLGDLTARLRAALHAEPFDAATAREIGAEMVTAHFTGTETLHRTVELLGVMEGDPERLRALQGAFAAGFAAALQERTQLEQESILRAMLAAWRQAEQHKRESDARFAAVFTQAGMGIGVGDLQGNILEVNDALLDMLGYSREELCRRTVADFVHPEDAPSVWPLYQELVRGERDHFRVDKRFFRSDGSVVWTQLAVSLVRDDAGAPKFQVAMMEDVTDRQQLQLRLKHEATHDPLTQLPNRALFQERLAAVFERPSSRVGLCYLDLDGFKVINDSLGHDVGDQLLVTVGQRLQACVAPQLAARIGGDEFVILVEDCSGTDEVIAVAEAVLAALAEPVHVCEHVLTVSASIGIVDRQIDETAVADLMQAADITLYSAKADGKGRWALHDEDRNAQEVTRFTLSATLPAALERGEFFVDYQPLVNLASGAVVGAEALVRWSHPTMGRLGPDWFIGLAEETGHIVELGHWVLRQACQQLQQWPLGYVSVNLAERQCRDRKLAASVAEILTETGIAPSRLQFELTESAMMGTSGETLHTLQELADMGVSIAIDDFGTGYSNLSYLRSLPVHELKIAGAFVDGLRSSHDEVDERIVETLVSLAHTLGLTVTGEGVETGMQARRLRSIGCDCAQGRFFAHPGPPETIAEMLACSALPS